MLRKENDEAHGVLHFSTDSDGNDGVGNAVCKL